jgi:penicillin-insensitive murein endopeptidase
MKWLSRVAVGALLFAVIAIADTTTNPWEQVTTPSHGLKGPIGTYDAGCVDGAVGLPMNGIGFQVMRLSRHRYYGDASLITFINALGAEIVANKINPILVGDMEMARGGPMPEAHASHQLGLDSDIWFWLDPVAGQRFLTAEERETLGAPAFVDIQTGELNRALWAPANVQILKLAAAHPEVDRIFVNSAIKRELCATEGNDPAFLHKIRPWFLHHDHFHVRLACPKGAALCVPQAPIPDGDGCDATLAWWSTPEVRAEEIAIANQLAEAGASGAEEPPGDPNVLPTLPAQCAEVVSQAD